MDHMFPSAYTSHRITRCTWFVRWQGLLNNSCVGSGCLVLMKIGPRGQHADWWSAHPRITQGHGRWGAGVRSNPFSKFKYMSREEVGEHRLPTVREQCGLHARTAAGSA